MMEQRNENSHWLNEVLTIEQEILDGRMPGTMKLQAIPEEIRMKSPLLLRAACEDGLLNGRIIETKQWLESALKGFAAQADESSMLSMMGMLGLLYEQVGDRQEAQPILAFLRQEWNRTPENCNGFVPWALARNAASEGLESGGDPNAANPLYFAAAEAFRRESRPVWSAFVLLDRLLFDPLTVGDSDWQLWLLYLERHLTEETYRDALYEVLAHRRPSIEQCDRLPARFAYLCKAVLLQAPHDKPVHELAGDIEIQVYVSAAKVKQLLASGNRVRAAIELQAMERLQQIVSTPATRRLYQSLSSSVHHQGDETEQQWQASESAAIDGSAAAEAEGEQQSTPVRWRIKLIDGILFSTQQGATAEPVWKRRKAGELLVYLLLQPGYKANREQVIERVFGEGEAAKRSNQLYVTLHDLRQTLKDIGMSQDPVYAKRGVIGIDEGIVDIVDAEVYITLSRVGDQLWLDDREAACRLYDEALPLYGYLATELPGTEWLERIREQLIERQTVMLKRLAAYYAEQQDEVRVEQRLADWIALRPEQEEAYEAMIRHCLYRSRRAEAIGWYRRLERMCRDNGTEPLQETKRLLWE